jgi:hypothetical protein
MLPWLTRPKGRDLMAGKPYHPGDEGCSSVLRISR